MQDNKNGGAGTTTNTKEPWAPAAPWIQQNLQTGQNLENKYLANPQSPQQQQAVNNIYGQSDYMRSLVPSLLGQMQGQQVGFDPSNPTAKPKAWNWQGLLGAGPNLNQGSMTGANVAPPAPAPSKGGGDDLSSFMQQREGLNSGNSTALPLPAGVSMGGELGGMTGSGGFGSFRYGAAPKAGTQAYSDMSKYFALGGRDPDNIYGSTYGLTAAPGASSTLNGVQLA